MSDYQKLDEMQRPDWRTADTWGEGELATWLHDNRLAEFIVCFQHLDESIRNRTIKRYLVCLESHQLVKMIELYTKGASATFGQHVGSRHIISVSFGLSGGAVELKKKINELWDAIVELQGDELGWGAAFARHAMTAAEKLQRLIPEKAVLLPSERVLKVYPELLLLRTKPQRAPPGRLLSRLEPCRRRRRRRPPRLCPQANHVGAVCRAS